MEELHNFSVLLTREIAEPIIAHCKKCKRIALQGVSQDGDHLYVQIRCTVSDAIDINNRIDMLSGGEQI